MKSSAKWIPIVGVLAVILAVSIFIYIQTSPSHQAKEAVEAFYTFEQEGKFSDSWELLHPLMKDKFSVGHYIQDRAHVFMNHFGVETFTFTIGDAKKLKDWKMEKGAKPLQNVYSFTVIQTFKGKYGHFDLHQNVYVVKSKDNWQVMWDYKK
ncbi:hypothetical protein [Halobacillus mangrovi]|uniref:Uncharacterized protein n=1 Tax=Halobacillus mangrovi TaxID=402384 RepID=A0A1W5ZT81_9BACI|nr:hypothetical protein [Halobacillus mangrovi]ARI76502.1 hypothetical protein HM131_06475 [Halobacillus mangrovi]